MVFLLANQNMPFTIALALMLLIAIVEGVATLIGLGVSGLLDSMLPDLDLDVGPDGVETGSSTNLPKVLGWLRVGKVPVLILFVIFLTAFGLVGLGIQSLANDLLGMLLPSLLVIVFALIICLPVVRICADIVARIMPKDETEAVSEKSFIGQVAVITLGTCRSGNAAQAKLKDRFGQTHYVMVEPDKEDEAFNQGASILIVRKQGAVFKAIANQIAVLE